MIKTAPPTAGLFCVIIKTLQIKKLIMDFIRKNIVAIAILIPIIFLAVVALYVYVPNRVVETDYDFVYATCDGGSYYYEKTNCLEFINAHYKVADKKLTYTEPEAGSDFENFAKGKKVRIFKHDTEKNISKEITLAEVEKNELSDLVQSPDGVMLKWSYEGSGDFLFFDGGRSESGYYLMKDGKKMKMNTISSPDSYYNDNNFKLIGWVL